jgi:hypothetical protein
MRRTTGQAALTPWCAAVAAGWLSLALRAQTPAFDVASIKENRSGGMDGVFRRQPGRFTVANLSLDSIIQNAYGIREYQLINAPSWTTTTSARRSAAGLWPIDVHVCERPIATHRVLFVTK